MTFGQNNTKELKAIIGEIKLSEILSAFNYIDNNGIPSKRGADTCYFIHNNIQYPVKLVTEIINNVIKNNTKQLSPAEHDPWQDAPLYDDIDFPDDIILITPYNNSGRKCVEQFRQELLDNFTSLNIVNVNTNYTKIEKDNKNIAEIHFLNKRDNQFKILVNYDLLPKEMTTTLKKSIKGFRKVPDSHKWTLNGEYYVTTNPQTVKFAIKAINAIIENNNNFDQIPTKFWLYAAGAKSCHWNEFYNQGIMAVGWNKLGNLKKYSSKEEIAKELQKDRSDNSYPMNDSKTNWEFANEMNIGDIVYVKKGLEPILLGRGVVASDYIFDDIRNKYKSIRKVNWTHNGIYNVDFNELDIKQWNQKTLTDISENKYKDFCKKIEKIFNNNAKEDKNMNSQPLNQILYGPPGTGKTYSIQKYIQNLLRENPGLNTNSEEQKLNDIVKDLSWYTTIAISMYLNGEQNKYKVSDLMNQKIIKAFALTRENKNLRAALWAQMQIHTSENCKTVNYTNRQAPFIFEKNENSEWYLTEDGIKYVEENLTDQITQYKAPSNTRKIEDFYKFITFHQSYSYEEFVEGIKPKIDVNDDSSTISYEYNRGIFKEICQQANSDPDNKYLLIIDEINRGNISKIFGELITLIETNKRVCPNKERNFENTKVDKEQLLVTLPYTKSKFGVPSNLYILGTMNTSDRSIASIDIALRRRFKFVEMMPRPEKLVDKNNQPLMVEDINLQNLLKTINERISYILDRDHQIGHSYFMNWKNYEMTTLKNVWFEEIMPLLNEYFYSDWDKLQAILGKANEIGVEKSFIVKIKKPNLPYEADCNDEEVYYNFVKKEDVNETDFRTMLKNAQLIESKSNVTSKAD